MATPESIHRLLSVASTLLDHAATEVRDARIEPVRTNIERIAKALAEVMEVRLELYKAQPGLAPQHPAEPAELSAANRRLTEYMYNASEFELAGDITQAVATFRAFLALESSPLHQSIATGEIERLLRAGGA